MNTTPSHQAKMKTQWMGEAHGFEITSLHMYDDYYSASSVRSFLVGGICRRRWQFTVIPTRRASESEWSCGFQWNFHAIPKGDKEIYYRVTRLDCVSSEQQHWSSIASGTHTDDLRDRYYELEKLKRIRQLFTFPSLIHRKLNHIHWTRCWVVVSSDERWRWTGQPARSAAA